MLLCAREATHFPVIGRLLDPSVLHVFGRRNSPPPRQTHNLINFSEFSLINASESNKRVHFRFLNILSGSFYTLFLPWNFIIGYNVGFEMSYMAIYWYYTCSCSSIWHYMLSISGSRALTYDELSYTWNFCTNAIQNCEEFQKWRFFVQLCRSTSYLAAMPLQSVNCNILDDTCHSSDESMTSIENASQQMALAKSLPDGNCIHWVQLMLG
jgi:hypothetical protein